MERRIFIIGGNSGVGGGLERYCERFQRAPEAVGDHEVRVEWVPGNSSLAGSSCLKLPFRLLTTYVRVFREARRLQVGRDAVWVQFGNAFDATIVAAARCGFRGRLLCTIHAGPQWKHQRSRVLRRWVGRCLAMADAVCVLSEEHRGRFTNIARDKVHVIPTLLPRWVFTIGSTPGPSGGRAGVLFTGRVVPEKGLEELVDALVLLHEQGCEVRVDIVGTGPVEYVRMLRAKADRLGVGPQIQWRGYLGEDEVRAMMLSRKVFAYPSHADAMPLSVLEATAAGMRIVAYALPGTKDILDEYGGLSVPEGDVDAFAHALRKAVSMDGPVVDQHRVLARFGWDTVWSHYRDLALGAQGGAEHA